MKSLILFCLAILAVSVSVKAQTKTPEIDVKYDRFKDQTRFSVEATETSDPFVSVLAMFDCPGQKPCTPDAVIFGFLVINQSEKYSGRGIARAIRDGVRQSPYQLEYMGISKANVLIPIPVHMFRAFLRPEGLAKIASSKLVEYQIDSIEFKLTEENLAGLRALIGRMQ